MDRLSEMTVDPAGDGRCGVVRVSGCAGAAGSVCGRASACWRRRGEVAA
jgi:hypothetical protein